MFRCFQITTSIFVRKHHSGLSALSLSSSTALQACDLKAQPLECLGNEIEL
jgi:hypothetical protein